MKGEINPMKKVKSIDNQEEECYKFPKRDMTERKVIAMHRLAFLHRLHHEIMMINFHQFNFMNNLSSEENMELI